MFIDMTKSIKSWRAKRYVRKITRRFLGTTLSSRKELRKIAYDHFASISAKKPIEARSKLLFAINETQAKMAKEGKLVNKNIITDRDLLFAEMFHNVRKVIMGKY